MHSLDPSELSARIPGRLVRLLAWCAQILLAISAQFALAEDVAVLYPDVPEPYARVFEDIIRGIDRNYDGGLKRYVLDKKTEVGDIESWLDQAGIVSVIALGSQAMNLALQLPAKYLTVAGAVLVAPEQADESFAAITMAPDPDLLFQQLKQFSPQIERVSVVYHAARHEQLIARARRVAVKYGLAFEAVSTEEVREGANLFKQMIENHQPEEDALWLLQDVPALEERSVLYMVLKEAWNQKILVISSNPSYVKKGALFSLYPDNVRLGERLAEAVVEQRKGAHLGIVPSRDLLTVVNIRTAEHLGLGVTRSQRREFDIVFPSR